MDKEEKAVNKRVEQAPRKKLKEVATKLCENKGLGDYCIKDLLAMAWVESKFKPTAIGDNGQSHGLFQISRYYHPYVSVEQARDVEFSVEWTLDRLISKGYPKYRSYSIMKHNGTPNTARTLSYLRLVNNY